MIGNEPSRDGVADSTEFGAGARIGDDAGVCTVTWLQTPGGYELRCNRDERHERADALPPVLRERDGVRLISPTDPDGGGSWITVNDHGLSLCLLNGYAAEDDLHPSAEMTSRGLLVLELADARDADDVARRLAARELGAFRSFRLLVLDGDSCASVLFWNRADGRLVEEAPELPLVSCPVRTDEVRSARRATLERLVAERGGLDAAVLEAFHRSRHPDGWVWSVSMQHDLAATRSHSHVRVTRSEVTFAYTPGRPCSTPARPPLALPRRR